MSIFIRQASICAYLFKGGSQFGKEKARYEGCSGLIIRGEADGGLSGKLAIVMPAYADIYAGTVL